MSASNSQANLAVIAKIVKSFKNLLKEFPQSAADDFIYDGSTIKKIAVAKGNLSEIITFMEKQPGDLGKEDRKALMGALKTLTQLMEELPQHPADEFLYDRMIHRKVVAARESLGTLNRFLFDQ